jgi:hypothetical protein
MFEEMQGLREVKIKIFNDSGEILSERTLLKPLMDIKVDNHNTQLELRWLESDDEAAVNADRNDLPFTIKRREKRVDVQGTMEIEPGNYAEIPGRKMNLSGCPGRVFRALKERLRKI